MKLPCFHGITAPSGPPLLNLIPPSSRWLPTSRSPPPTSSYSLRIDGASALAVAGADDKDIMILGHWKLLVFLNYIRPSKLSSSRSMKLIVDPAILDVHRFSRRVARTLGFSASKLPPSRFRLAFQSLP